MKPEVFRMTIPKWFSKLRREARDRLEEYFKSLCDDEGLAKNDSLYALLQEKKDAIVRVLNLVDLYFNRWEPKGDDDADVLACLRQVGYSGILYHLPQDPDFFSDDETAGCFSAQFIFAASAERYKRTILDIYRLRTDECGVVVGWNSGDGGVACLRESNLDFLAFSDSSEEFFDAVLDFDWGLIMKATVHYGAFSVEANFAKSKRGDDCEEEARNVINAILSGSHELQDLAEEALMRDFNGGPYLGEHFFNEDYVLRYAFAIVDTLDDRSAAKRMAEHDLEHIFTQMRKYERMAFDHAVLQEYSSQEDWRHEVMLGNACVVKFTAEQFMNSLYRKLPKRLHDQCTRGAIGLPDDQECAEGREEC